MRLYQAMDTALRSALQAEAVVVSKSEGRQAEDHKAPQRRQGKGEGNTDA